MPVGMITLLGPTHILFGLTIWLVQGGDVCSTPMPVHELAVVDHILLSGVLVWSAQGDDVFPHPYMHLSQYA